MYIHELCVLWMLFFLKTDFFILCLGLGSFKVLIFLLFVSKLQIITPYAVPFSLCTNTNLWSWLLDIVFSLVRFPSKSCLFKSCTTSYITYGVLNIMSPWDRDPAPALKSPPMTDKDITQMNLEKNSACTSQCKYTRMAYVCV